MKTTRIVVTGLLTLVLPLACSSGEDSAGLESSAAPRDTLPLQLEIPDPEAAVPLDGAAENMVLGQVTQVDDFLGTFSVRNSVNKEWEFRFSDFTEIIGDGGTQGLAGTEGSRAAVYYQEGPDSDLAVRIELLDDTTSAGPIVQ